MTLELSPATSKVDFIPMVEGADAAELNFPWELGSLKSPDARQLVTPVIARNN